MGKINRQTTPIPGPLPPNNGYLELPITSAHTRVAGRLPNLHQDPFDRILAAQANDEGIQLLTADKTLAAYPSPITLVDQG